MEETETDMSTQGGRVLCVNSSCAVESEVEEEKVGK